MKSFLLFVLPVLMMALNACDDNDTDPKDELTGAWLLSKRFDGGSPTPIQIVQDGEIITFGQNNDFFNNKYQCQGGYSVQDNIIKILIPCLSNDSIQYSYDFLNGDLQLTSFPSTCDEGCYDLFTRTN